MVIPKHTQVCYARLPGTIRTQRHACPPISFLEDWGEWNIREIESHVFGTTSVSTMWLRVFSLIFFAKYLHVFSMSEPLYQSWFVYSHTSWLSLYLAEQIKQNIQMRQQQQQNNQPQSQMMQNIQNQQMLALEEQRVSSYLSIQTIHYFVTSYWVWFTYLLKNNNIQSKLRFSQQLQQLQ